MEYDKDQADSDAAYTAFVEWLENKTATELQAARGKKKTIKAAIAAYLEKGYRAHLTVGERRDSFAYSTPCVLDRAGYSEKEMDMACEIYDELNPAWFARYFQERES